jgi:hypothetical protein
MNKKLTPIPATAKVKAIPGTKYVLIDGDKLARLLTPSAITDDDVYYLPILKKGQKPKEISAKDLNKLNN